MLFNIRPLEPAAVREMIINRDADEVAILDVRPTGTFGDGHLLWANSVPLSTIELDIHAKVPRKTTPIILCAGGFEDEHLIERGGTKLASFGYSNLYFLKGGVAAWGEAELEVFTGVNVPSKAFGEFVEHTYDTPRISPEELKQMIDEESDFVVLDSRPMDEYQSMNIPTGINVPGGELVKRLHDLAPEPSTRVIVNCAGRTRSIIGCQSLINAGISNSVVALENGTMGWHLAGFDLEYGQGRTYKSNSDEGDDIARARAAAVRKRFGVQRVTLDQVTEWQREPNRTLYMLDVRSPEEFEVGHLPGAQSAPGGQLVQATDQYIGTLGSRVVCIDDDGIRAGMAASWLVQMGWQAFVLDAEVALFIETGFVPAIGSTLPAVPTIRPRALAARMIQTHVVDVGDSLMHRRAHIPASRFAIRANLPETLIDLSRDRPIAITSSDGILAKLAVADLLELGWDGDVMALEGGTNAWEESGLPLKGGFENNLDDAVDVWYRPYDMDDAQEGAMKQYLSWEVNLVQQIERDGTTNFKVFDLGFGV